MSARLEVILRDLSGCVHYELVLVLAHFFNLIDCLFNQVDFLLKFLGNRLNLRSVLNVAKFETQDLLL